MNVATQKSKSITNTKRKLSIKNSSSKSKSETNRENRDSHIAVAAYYKAQARGFEPGNELEDWLAAEAEENQ